MPPSREETWNKTYLNEYAKGKSLVHGEMPDSLVIWTANYLKEKGMSRAIVLDTGCGEGRNCVYLAGQGFKVWGIDIASPAIEMGQRWIRSEGLTEMVKLSVGDVADLPYEPNFFDAVIDIFTIEFIPQRKRYVQEVARVLKSKGLFFIRTHKPPAKHGLGLESLEATLERDFRVLEIQNPSSDTLNVIAEKKS